MNKDFCFFLLGTVLIIALLIFALVKDNTLSILCTGFLLGIFLSKTIISYKSTKS